MLCDGLRGAQGLRSGDYSSYTETQAGLRGSACLRQYKLVVKPLKSIPRQNLVWQLHGRHGVRNPASTTRAAHSAATLFHRFTGLVPSGSIRRHQCLISRLYR